MKADSIPILSLVTAPYTPEEALAGLRAVGAFSAEISRFGVDASDLTETPEDDWCGRLDVKHALQQLPDQQQLALFLHLAVGLSEADAAELMGIRQQSLSRRVQAGLVHLFEILGVGRRRHGRKGDDVA